MKKENVIKSCYSVLRKTTPLNFDCGKICNGKCCKGDDKTGMLLFPGEENFIDPDINVIETKNGDKLAVCDGTCDRNRRPLSCRIYPLFPVVIEEAGANKVKVCFDYRADCPLYIPKPEHEFNKRFLKGVRRVGEYLLLNEETKELLLDLSDMQKEYYDLLEKLK